MKKPQVIRVKGSNFEIGCQIGEKTRKGFETHYNWHHFDRKTGPDFEKRYIQYLNLMRKKFPHIIRELEGLAHGLERKYSDVFFFSVFELFKKPGKGCTTLAFKNEDRVLMAHNEDGRTDKNPVYIVKAEYEDGLKILGLNYYGYLPGFSFTLNSHGMCQTMNYLPMNTVVEGIPVYISMRKTIELKSLQEARDYFRKNTISGGGNFLFGQKNDYVNFESREGKNLMLKNGPSFYHINHFQHPKLKKYNAGHNLENSFVREKYAQKFISENPKAGFKQIREFLSSRSKDSFSVCRDKEKFENEFKSTFASAFFDSSKPKELKICYGPPDKNKFERYSL